MDHADGTDEPGPPGVAAVDVRRASIELRTPMAVILARAEMLEQRILTGDVTNVYACLATLKHIEAAITDLDARISALEART